MPHQERGEDVVARIRSLTDCLAGLMFIGFGAAAVVIGRDYPMGSAMRMGPGYFPTILGALLAVLGAAVLVRSLLGSPAPAPSFSLKALAVILAAVAVFAFTVERLGIVAAVRGDLSQAISQFETAARLDPLHFESRNNLGKALAATGDYPGAVAAYNAALALDRNSAEAWYNLGAVQLMAGRNTDAEKSLRHSLELDPSRPDGHYNLGLALWRQQRLEPAVQAMHEALRLRPNHLLAKSALRDLEASATR